MILQKADPRRILRHPAVYSAFTIAMGGRFGDLIRLTRRMFGK